MRRPTTSAAWRVYEKLQQQPCSSKIKRVKTRKFSARARDSRVKECVSDARGVDGWGARVVKGRSRGADAASKGRIRTLRRDPRTFNCAVKRLLYFGVCSAVRSLVSFFFSFFFFCRAQTKNHWDHIAAGFFPVAVRRFFGFYASVFL